MDIYSEIMEMWQSVEKQNFYESYVKAHKYHDLTHGQKLCVMCTFPITV